MSSVYRAQTADARQILIAMGMGQYNATMVIPYLFIPPATTDADMPQVIMLVELVQRRINSLGGSLTVTGRLDQPTVAALNTALGPSWPKMTWYELCRQLIAATDVFARAEPASRGRAQAMSGYILPDIPGDLIAVGLVFLGWHLYKEHKKRKGH